MVISLVWIGIPVLLGYVFALAAVGPGGASGIFVFLGFLLGLIGGSIHCFAASLQEDSKIPKAVSVLSMLGVFSFVSWIHFAPPTCFYSESQATEKIEAHIVWLEGEIQYLESAKFAKEDCSYSFTYEHLDEKYEYVFSNWGEVHTWDYSQGDL